MEMFSDPAELIVLEPAEIGGFTLEHIHHGGPRTSDAISGAATFPKESVERSPDCQAAFASNASGNRHYRPRFSLASASSRVSRK